jgi:hypothetical protein
MVGLFCTWTVAELFVMGMRILKLPLGKCLLMAIIGCFWFGGLLVRVGMVG